jgi:protein-disulfide isomerase
MPAARATECVAETVQWHRWIDQLYAQQDSLGRKPWAHFAREAGVVDTAAITACVEGSATFPRIDEGLRLAKAAALRGTPSVILNGRLFSALPTPAIIDSVVASGGQRSR